MRKLLLSLGLTLGLLTTAPAVVVQTLMGNANLTGVASDQRVVTTTAFTASRTYTLPAAAASCIGQSCPANALVVFDVANAVSAGNTLTIAPATGDTINGSTSSLTIATAGSRVELIPITGTNWFAQVMPGTMQTESGAVGAQWATGRNYLDNGNMAITQRGTGTITCAANAAITSTAYGPDRWGCSANVGSGAGRQQIVTSSPTPPAGSQNVNKLWRNSGGLTQPVCSWQEIPTARAVQLAGQSVTVSAQVAALAGLSADNGNVANLVVITGTGTDEGFGTMTASPAITPAWTGIATPLNQSITLTTSFAKFSASVAIGSTVTEIGVGICFTPTATGAGATDGLAFTQIQLEKGLVATPFEFRPVGAELQEAQRYYWQVTEPAASVSIGASGQGASTTTCILSIALPVTMRAAPTYASAGNTLANTTWTVTHVVTNTVLSTPFLAATTGGHTVNMLNLTATTGAALTTGQTCTLTGAGGGNIITASADF